MIAAGGVDKFLTIYTLQKSNTADSFTFTPPVKAAVLNGFPGPLLSLDIAPATVEVVVPAAVATAAVRGCVWVFGEGWCVGGCVYI